MPRVAIQLVQGAGKPAFDAAVAVAKADPAGIITARLVNGSALETTVFDVTAAPYNADRTGVAPCQSAVQAAYNAARLNSRNGAHSTILFPPGTYRYSGSVLLGTIRTNDWHVDPDGGDAPTAVSVQQAGMIVFLGYGATIRYDNVTTRYSWLRMGAWPTAQYTTYGNISVEGFTIDNNWKNPSGTCGYICWMTGNGNYDNITFKDITTTDHIAPRLTWSQGGPNGITIHGDDVSASQAHWGYCTNITVENCVIHAGGKSISILAENYGFYERDKYVFDEINIIGGYMDNHEYYGSNIHLVQAAAGYRVSCVGVDCRDSADDGIEINNCNETVIEDCHFEGNRQPICLTWFSYPFKTSVPTTTMRGNTYSGKSGRYWTRTTDAYNDLRSPMMPEVRGYMTNTTTANCKGRSYGHFLIEDCDLEIGFVDDYTVARSPFTIGSNSIPMESVTIKDCDIRYDGSLGADIIYVRQGAQLGRTLPVTIQNVRYASSIGGALQTITADMVTLVGSVSVTSDVGGL